MGPPARRLLLTGAAWVLAACGGATAVGTVGDGGSAGSAGSGVLPVSTGGASSFGAGGSATVEPGAGGSAPTAGRACGNGYVDPGEACDGVDLNGETCASATMYAAPLGELSCTARCLFDVGGCYGSGGAGGSGGTPATSSDCFGAAQRRGEPIDDPTCGSGCLCRSCSQELIDCQSDFGCQQIRACAEQTGCTGIDCYQPNTCQTVIDSVGGPFGPSTAIAQALGDCGVTGAPNGSQCRTSCTVIVPVPDSGCCYEGGFFDGAAG